MRISYSAILLALLFLSANTVFGQELNVQGNNDSRDSAIARFSTADAQYIEEALDLAGTNSQSLVNGLLQIPDEWLPGAAFLIENLPVEDLTVISEELFVATLRDAYYAHNNFPWAQNLSVEDFFHYVLPPRVSQEPLEKWREVFLAELEPLVRNAETIEEATDIVNEWMWSQVSFKQTQRRDQGPFETLAGGCGRCEELMILQIDACRSVGIPARQAWTPYWTYQDNNHAWTEFMNSDGEWYQKDGWINIPTQRTNFIFSVPFGIPENDPHIYRTDDKPGSRYSILNSIGNYRDTCVLNISVIDESGNPVGDTNVVLSVYNWGALRSVARGKTDENGVYRIEAGVGGHFISAGNSERGACMSIQLEEAGDIDLTLVLMPLDEIETPDSFWLRYPMPEEG
ncbi:MAG TPA: transglutaminase domain-containing protein [bacterium]|jgi:hypothetical protein